MRRRRNVNASSSSRLITTERRIWSKAGECRRRDCQEVIMQQCNVLKDPLFRLDVGKHCIYMFVDCTE